MAMEGVKLSYENKDIKLEILAMNNNNKRKILINILEQCQDLEREMVEMLQVFFAQVYP